MLMLLANPMVRKAAIYVGVGLVILYALRLWGNAQWKKGEERGRVNAVDYLEKQKIIEWKVKEEQLELRKAKVETDKAQLLNERKTLDSDREAMQKSLSDGLARFNRQRVKNNETANKIKRSELVPAIRTLSGELAIAK